MAVRGADEGGHGGVAAGVYAEAEGAGGEASEDVHFRCSSGHPGGDKEGMVRVLLEEMQSSFYEEYSG